MNGLLYIGFNSTLRGGNVTHHEYIQVGKGRDVGLNQISMFEAKIANGNGEQTLSRDVYRLGHRFDFFRMLSCYFTTIGFYFNNLVSQQFYSFCFGVKHKACFLTFILDSYMADYCAYCVYIPIWTSLSCA